MKSVIIFLAVALSAAEISRAQGTVTYLSNLGQPSAGSLSVGSNSWVAAGCFTGTSAARYSLDSIQLAMTGASGNPSGFTVMVYANRVPPAGFDPGISLGTLNGSLDPVTSGIYTYTPASSLTLSPSTLYWVVLTAGTPIANGAYEWSYAGINSYNPSGGWGKLGGVSTSSNGSLPWIGSGSAFPQVAISGTAIPEPSTLGLLALGGFLLVRHHRKSQPM
jgi:hypothetical protein